MIIKTVFPSIAIPIRIQDSKIFFVKKNVPYLKKIFFYLLFYAKLVLKQQKVLLVLRHI
jgi:hypothetical protein